uniref:Uncharacterized protein n=1 Tax=Helianthus annuus TaxID=4232 RepID=A0A251VIH3_HELAN
MNKKLAESGMGQIGRSNRSLYIVYTISLKWILVPLCLTLIDSFPQQSPAFFFSCSLRKTLTKASSGYLKER